LINVFGLTRRALNTQREPPMSQSEYDAAVAAFLRSKDVTRCPTAFVAPTNGWVAEVERAALRSHETAQEAARLEKLKRCEIGFLATGVFAPA
jgi:hypothetical protein